MKFVQYLLLLFFLFSLQFSIKLQAQEACGFDPIHQKRLAEDPEYRARLVENERKIQSWLASPSARGSATYTIPVVVHVMHLGEAVGTGTNISDAQVQSAIDRMTEVYLNNDGVGDGVNTGIEFCLADVTPDCQATSGIVRVDATVLTDYSSMGIEASSSDGSDEVETKDLSRWNPEEYLNIWVVSEIDDNNGGSGTQGYSRQPAGAPYDYDGVVLLYNAMGYDPGGSIGYNLKSYTQYNATLIHEVAHYLDIYHTFNGDSNGTTCPSNSDCATDGDFICDTDPHIRSSSNCPGGNNSCTGTSNANIVDNYMDYSSQTCKDRFTSGQAARMVAALNTSRVGLWNSQGCSGNTTTPVAASCSPTTSSPHPTAGIGIEDITIGTFKTNSGNTYEEGAYLDRSCRNFTVEPNTTYSIDIQSGSSNAENVKIYIDYNNNGVLSDSGEEVFSSVNAISHTGSFTTPMYPETTGTPIRIRVIADFANFAITGPCMTLTYGQAEDFSMTINPLEPTITTSENSLAGFRANSSSESSIQTFTVSGEELKDMVTLTTSGSAYELSTDGSTFSNSLNLTNDNYNLTGEPVTVHVRLKSGQSAGDQNETLTLSSSDATDVPITLTGKTINTDAVRGNAINLDGTGDFVLTTFTGISGTDSRTFEAWIKTNSATNDMAIMGYGANSSFEKWVVRLDAGRLRVEVNSGYKFGTTDLRDDEWHHIAVVLDNTSGATLDNTTLYVDGIIESISGSTSTSSTLNTGSSQGMWIGNDHSSRHFEGAIEEVAIWDVARTQAQIREALHMTLSGLESGLIAYYQMNDNSSTASDKVSGADGTLNGDASFIASTLAVAAGSCSTISLGSDGTGGVEVNSNNIQIDFANGSGTMPDGDLVIFKLNEDVFNGPTYDDQSDQYWVIKNFGTNQNSLDVESIIFTLESGDDILSSLPANISLHKRASGSDGEWLEMAETASSINSGTGDVTFSGLTGFNTFSMMVAGEGTALPVEWLNFEAVRIDEKEVKLSWATASEIDNLGFEVEYSLDGITFEYLDFVKGAGTSLQVNSYSKYYDENRGVYYRLRQRDQNGDHSLSPIRYVEAADKNPIVRVFPNPNEGYFQIQISNVDPDQEFELRLLDTSGRILIQEKGTIYQLNSYLANAQDQLPKGLLMMQLKSNDMTLTKIAVSVI